MRLGFAIFNPFDLRLANRAFCARLIFLRTAADIVRRFLVELIDFDLNPDNAKQQPPGDLTRMQLCHVQPLTARVCP